MAQYDVYRLRDRTGIVVDIQSDLLSHFKTRLVVPLLPLAVFEPESPRLNPVFGIDNDMLALAPQGTATVLVYELGEKIASLQNSDYQISRAVDFLVNGY